MFISTKCICKFICKMDANMYRHIGFFAYIYLNSTRGLNKMAEILQTAFEKAFSLIKIAVFWFEFAVLKEFNWQ